MQGKPEDWLRITRARELLRSAVKDESASHAKAIALSNEWLENFQSLKDANLVCPTHVGATGITFWGVRVEIAKGRGSQAVVTFEDGSASVVALEPA